MSLVTEVEQIVLEQLAETGASADNWSGTDEVRDAVASSLDEFLAVGKFRRESIIFPLAANTSVYSVIPQNGIICGIYGVRYLDQTRPLKATGLISLSLDDPRFLLTRGSPWAYIPLDFTKLLIYPCPSTAVGLIEVDALILSSPYTTYPIEEDVSWDWRGILVEGALSYMYLLIPGEEKRSALHYQKFLAMIGVSGTIQKNWNRFVFWQKKGAQE